MSAFVAILLVLAAADLIACGILLAIVWAEHRRMRNVARANDEPVPRPATGQFLFLGLAVALGIALLYTSAAVLFGG